MLNVNETLSGSDILHLIGVDGRLGIVSHRQSKAIYFLLVTDAATVNKFHRAQKQICLQHKYVIAQTRKPRPS